MPSANRGGVWTTSTCPHGQRCATAETSLGALPSWAATVSKSLSVGFSATYGSVGLTILVIYIGASN